MDLSDDLPPPRRPLFFPVVIATTFLSIIGMSAGLLLGAQRDRDQATPPVNDPIQTSQTEPTASPSPSRSPRPTPSGPVCRDETVAAAEQAGFGGPLARELRIRTRTSEVYVCSDPEGRLFYHANNGGDVWEEGRTALFLTDVRPADDGYHATASDGTEFVVNVEELTINHADGRVEVQRAVD